MKDVRMSRAAFLKTVTATALAGAACYMNPRFFLSAAAANTVQKGYTINKGNTTVYSDEALTQEYGTIFDTDEVIAEKISANVARVTYPTKKGTKTGYIFTPAMFLSAKGSRTTASKKITTYIRPDGAKYGSVSAGDSILILGTSGCYAQIRYPLDSGGYKFGFVLISDLGGSSYPLEEGLYVVRSTLNSSKVLDIANRDVVNGANCQLYDQNNTTAQVFRFIPVDKMYYIIQLAMTDNMVLGVCGKGDEGCSVQLYQYNGTDAQLWTIESTTDSEGFRLKSKTGYYLDITEGRTGNGTNILVRTANVQNPNYQRVKFVPHYCVADAVKYAKKYTDSSGGISGVYNDKYNIYKQPRNHNPLDFEGYNPVNYLGYDCANFGSQCLFNAGFVATEEWKPVYRGEAVGDNAGRIAWVRASSLYSYLRSAGYPAQRVNSDLSNIHLGDIVFTGEGVHTTICTGYSNGKPLYCAHSVWRKDFPYSYDDFKNGYVIDLSFNSCRKANG